MQDVKRRFLEEIRDNGSKMDFNQFEEDLIDLIDWGNVSGYISDLTYSKMMGGRISINTGRTRITMDGKGYLKSLDTPVVVEPIQVEVISDDLKAIASYFGDLTEGQKEIIKHLAQHGDILDEMRFLEADKVAIMKEKLVKLRGEDPSGKLPWDTLIALAGLLVSVA